MPRRAPPALLPKTSGFRLSLAERLALAACLILPLWAALMWAIR
jgi:hypothetical protein